MPSSDFDLQYKDSNGVWRVVQTFTTSNAPNTTFEGVGLNVRTRLVRVVTRRSWSDTHGVILSEVQLSGDLSSSCGTTYRIDSVHSGKALDVEGWSRADGGRLQQWAYHGGGNQRWLATLQSARRVAEFDIQPTYQLRNLRSGKCLDIDGPSMASGAAIHQWTCYDIPSQRFTIEAASNGQSVVRSAYSRKCLDVDAWGASDGAKLIQWDCHGGANQKWQFRQP